MAASATIDEEPEDTPPPVRTKRKLAPPTTFSDVVYGMSLQIARKYLFFNVYKKVMYYSNLVLLGSLFAAAAHTVTVTGDNSHRWYLARKSNLFNQLFVKFGWAWSMSLLGPFVYMTSVVYSGNKTRNVRQQMARLVIATLIWYFCTSTFISVERKTGTCSLPELSATSKADCRKQGGTWLQGFDISGHCFMLIYLCLIMTEECQVFRNWDKMLDLLQTPDANELKEIDEADIETSIAYHKEYTNAIKYIMMAMCVLHAIWDVMLVITVIYYHTMPHKLAGTVVAILAWFITYRVWYKTRLSPGMPGHGPLKYSTWKKKL